MIKKGSEKMVSKKFLFVSKDSLSGDLAYKLQNEGHQVKVYFADPYCADAYDGFVEKVKNWRHFIDWADIVIFDDENFGLTADRLRTKKKLVIGGSRYTDRLETDRNFGQEELKKYGIAILPSLEFDDYDDALEYVRKHPDQYVFKASKNGQPGAIGFVFISEQKNGDDFIEFLELNKDYLKSKVRHFILQKYVKGIEIAVGAFFNGKDFIYPINVNFEHKRLFPTNLGPLTGEMGTLMYWGGPNKIFKTTLAKFKEPLAKSGYAGYIDLNCMVNETGIYPLEFTSRFGYPTLQIQLAGISEPAGEWLYKLASGKKFRLATKDGFQIGVVIATPPLLSEGRDKEDANMYKNLSIFFKNNKISKHVHLGDVKRDEKGVWRLAGNSGWSLIVTGCGKTVQDARDNAYYVVENIKIQNMFYRDDIGSGWSRERKKLHTWKLI